MKLNDLVDDESIVVAKSDAFRIRAIGIIVKWMNA
jgi:hypothetical protein